MKLGYWLMVSSLLFACENKEEVIEDKTPSFYFGADLSYINEVEDCGAVFRENGELVEPFQLFADKGMNLVRVRLWNNPDWTKYSDYEDVKKTIARAKASNMEVLLDFHYSDNWADPGDQVIPKAWAGISDTEVLADSVYQFTYQTLMSLHQSGLLPEMVQVGNETNSEILLAEHTESSDINWERNLTLLNRGLKAVNDVAIETGLDIETMIHIAQPENALVWFANAHREGIAAYDWMGLSYYPKWSTYSLPELSGALDSLKRTYQKRLMIVETSYPYTLVNVDSANNVLGADALIDGYPASKEGQLKYMVDLTKQIIAGGGEGLAYWEPAWVSSDCYTLWGKGSHWENATFFDAEDGNEVLPVFGYLKYDYNNNNNKQK
ncbi:MAG: arabinogalactan endo-1,4-beta-galactosidase [Reichenbachiella sp.]